MLADCMQSEPNPVAFDRIPFPNLTPPIQDQSKPLVSVSTRFNPEKKDIQDADVVLITEDRVYFYAHREILLGRSSNNFGSLLYDPAHGAGTKVDVPRPMDAENSVLLPTIVATTYTADVLNVVLHFVYVFPVESYRPSPATLRAATAVLFDLGYSLADTFVAHSEPYMLFLQAGVSEPLAMYAVAAQYSLESLAVAVSTFTLAVSPSDVSDELAQQMGPVYLRRLFFLHLGRADALKRLLYPPPLPHPASDLSCDPRSQQEVGRIWALACASVVVENHPNELVKVVTPLSAQLSCPNCRQTLNDRVAALIRDWGAVKATI
ncbi:hypothetical protein FRC08_014042 [Ceratobasidium sp. 394]|nr:hypothetical protein FRC08_014042 [Ceratobasidium sp. 394]